MPETKRFFPGVTQEYLDRQDSKLQKQQEKSKRKEERAQKAYDAKKNRAELLQKYGVNAEIYAKERREAIKGAVFGGAVGAVFWFCLNFYVNDFIDAFQGKDVFGQEWTKPAVNPLVDGKFQPTATWYRQLAFLVVSVCVALGVTRAYGGDYFANKKIVDAVDMMTWLKGMDRTYNLNEHPVILNTHHVKRLVRVVPHIIQRMSSEERIYFDMLMDGKINIQDNKTFMDMAVAIMMGHLDSHPKDAQLILDTFDERSLPDNLLSCCKMYTQYNR